MDEPTFWSLIDQCRTETASCEDLADQIVEHLTALPADEIVSFGAVMDQVLDRAYRWDLWGAAYLINGGCSDDGFEYFRGWPISQGRERYEQALGNPESLADFAEPEVECEDILYAPVRAYEAVTGSDQMPPRYAEHPEEPTGSRWTEEELETLFPRLAEAFG